MDITTLLTEILGSPHRQKDEALYQCPFCVHPKKKLSINQLTHKWKCWVCNARGMRILSLLKRLNLPKKKIEQFKEILGETKYTSHETVADTTVVQLPVEYKPLWKPEKSYAYLHALTYLQTRNIGVDEILRYRIGYCDSGPYTHRIIVPSYDSDNQLNYFTARSYYDSGMKYKNPPVSKNTIIFENMISWNEPVILCEGMFDAIALRQNAIPLMGKTLSKKLEWALLHYSVEDVIIFLDHDARLAALKLEQRLNQYDINVRVVLTDTKDASDMGFTSAWKAVHAAQKTEFKDYIKHKLFT
jgi:5S rRNA maturation endonuclease (ribonuclease M5)